MPRTVKNVDEGRQFHMSREAVRKARHVLDEAERGFDCDKGLDDAATTRLIANIRTAEVALADAKAVVLRTGAEHCGPHRRYV